MKSKISFAKGIALFSLVTILFLGIYLYSSPRTTTKTKTEIIHTYLIKVPDNAGVCPYALMSMTNGKLKMVNNPSCVCPFSEHATYMTARCKDKKSVMAMLPASLRKKVQILIVDNSNNKQPNNFIKSKSL